MRSLSQGVLIVAILILLIISLLGGLTMSNINGLGAASRRLADDVLAEEQALTQFQILLDRTVINAVGYTRSRQAAELQSARDAMTAAKALLPELATLTGRNDKDTQSEEQQKLRVE